MSLRFVHLLSKDARRRLVDVMLNSRSMRKLSEILGVTPAAISKYKSGATHPSDEVVELILRNASNDEVEEIARIAFDDLHEGFKALIEWMADRGLLDMYVIEKLRRMLRDLEENYEVKRARMIIR